MAREIAAVLIHSASVSPFFGGLAPLEGAVA
jgi:hypothetical protein